MKTMKKIVAILAVALMLCSILPLSVMAADTYELATSIEVGDTVVLACTSKKMELSGISTTSTKYGIGVAYSSAPTGAYVLTVEAGSTSGTYSFKCPNGQYLYWTSGNSLATNATKSANTSWTVTFSGNNAIIKNAKDTARQLQWNASSPRFACYGNSGQTAVQLFKKVTEPEVPSACEHTNAAYTHDCQPTICPDCEETLPALTGHTYNESVTLAPTCTEAGEKTLTCACGDVKTEAVNALGHNYVDGACDVCGEAEPNEVKYTFSDYTAGTQYAKNEKHKLDNVVTMTTTDCHFTSELRIYSSSTNNGYAVITSTKPIVSITLNAGNKVDTLNLYYSESATAADATISVTATSYNDYTVDIPAGTQYIKLDVKGSNQVRIKYMTLSFAAPSDCEHDYVGVETQAPTCSAEGVMTHTCSKCQESYTEAIAVIAHNYVEDIIDATCTTTGTKTYECSVCFHSYDETIPVKAHNYVDDVCADCGHVKAYKGTITFADDKSQRTEYVASTHQKWENEGLTFINNKANSTNDIGDFTDPAGRFYKSSGIIIEFSEMSTLIIDAKAVGGTKYAWDDTLNAAGLAFTEVDGIYTITFAEAKNSLELTAANQVRANSITAIVAHECVWADATCTAPKTCSKCGATEGETLGHTYFDDCSAICEVCGYEREVSHNVIHMEAKAATCAENGNIEYWYCDVCGMAWLDEACTMNTNLRAVKLPATGEHTYDNAFDADCNVCNTIREITNLIVGGGISTMEMDNGKGGVAAQFTAAVEGLAVKAGTLNEADYTNATIGGYKLITMGVIASNGTSTTNITCKYLMDLEKDSTIFAARIKNIPEKGYDVEITFQSYFVVEIDGVETTIYGDVQTGAYNG